MEHGQRDALMWYWPVLSRLSKVCDLQIYRHDNVNSFVVVLWCVILAVVVHRMCLTASYTDVGLTNHWVVGCMPVGIAVVVKTCLFVESMWSAWSCSNITIHRLIFHLVALWHVILALAAVVQCMYSIFGSNMGLHICQWDASLWKWLLCSSSCLSKVCTSLVCDLFGSCIVSVVLLPVIQVVVAQCMYHILISFFWSNDLTCPNIC
jgi:hypothetical protein